MSMVSVESRAENEEFAHCGSSHQLGRPSHASSAVVEAFEIPEVRSQHYWAYGRGINTLFSASVLRVAEKKGL